MFEHSLIDLETKQQPRRRRWISLPIAVALHVVGLSAFAFASYWSVGSVPEPDTNVVFFQLAPVPELPAGGGGGGRPEPPAPQPAPQPEPVRPSQPVQPTDETVPEDLPTPTANTTAVEDLGPVTDSETPGGGIPGLPPGPGFGSGPVGPGTGGPGGPGDGPEIGVVDDQPIRFTVGMTKPEPVHQVQPRYTEIARRAGVQGTVIVEAIIDEQGNVDNVRVLRSLPLGLDREAVAAVQQWKFTPARMANKPVKVYFVLTVNFGIQR